jgi:hypothetical protein
VHHLRSGRPLEVQRWTQEVPKSGASFVSASRPCLATES